MDIPGKTFQHDSFVGSLLIRPDLSSHYAATSLPKCLQLASCWPTRHQVCFVLDENSPALAEKRIRDRQFECCRMPGYHSPEAELAELKILIADRLPAAFVFDRPIDQEHVQSLQRLSVEIVPLRDEEFAFQPRYFIANRLEPNIETKKIAAVARRIAITTHEHSRESLATEILNSLDQITTHSFSVDFCVPPTFGQGELLRDLASASQHSIRIHRSIGSIESLLPRIDVGIVDFGPNCLHLANHAIPMLATPSFNDPLEIRESLERAGAVKTLSIDGDDFALSSALRSFVRNRDQRQQLSDAAVQLVDGNGARRIISMLTDKRSAIRKAS